MRRKQKTKAIAGHSSSKKRTPLFRRRLASRISAGMVADFSEIENSAAGIDEIQKLAGLAGLAAASEAKAVGIPRVFVRENEIIREYPDGHAEIVSAVAEDIKEYYVSVKPEVLHARKK